MLSSSHEDFSRAHDVRVSSDRSFGFVFTAAFAIIGLLPLRHGAPIRVWALALAAAFAILALARPSLLKPLNRLWFKLGLLLGRIVNPVVTGILFYGVITPFGILLRKRDPLRLRFNSSASSYWIERQPPGPAPDTMARQF